MSFESRRYNLATVRDLIIFLLRRNPDGFAPYRVMEFIQSEIGCTPELAQEYTSTVFSQLDKEEIVERCEEGFRIKKYEPKVTPDDLKLFDECVDYLKSISNGFVEDWVLRQCYFRRSKSRDTRKFECILRLKGL